MNIAGIILQDKFKEFLREDLGFGDLTTRAVVPSNTAVKATVVLKEPAVVAGLAEVESLLFMLKLDFNSKVNDADEVEGGTDIIEIVGNGRRVLGCERTILNILMRMSGIATATNRMIKLIKTAGLKSHIAGTRKTVPGIRYFDKRAIEIGGGDPHRLNLDDSFLIKDNHLEIAGSVTEAVSRVRKYANFIKKIEVEAKTTEQAIEAARLGVDAVMLDNMSIDEAKKTIEAFSNLNLRRSILVEISGGITPENIIDYARLEPDIISMGSLTSSVKAIDMSLEILEVEPQSC